MATVSEVITGFSKKLKRDITVEGEDPTRIPTGIFAFDLATGGGFPVGRVSLLYGAEAAMKTTVALKGVAQAQKLQPDKTAIFIDVEGHFTKSWAMRLGVDCSPAKLQVIRPDNAEEVVDLTESFILADDLSVIVVDSLAAMVTIKELDSDADKALVGNSGIVINKFYRKTSRAISAALAQGLSPTLILINQIRYKIGVMFGSPETLPGGPSFKFASSLSVRLYGKDEKDSKISDDLPAFRTVSVIIKKHKVPIVATNTEFSIALVDNPPLGLKFGDPHDIPTIMAYLKAKDMLIAQGKEWGVVFPSTGEIISFKTQAEIKTRLIESPEFKLSIQTEIIDLTGKEL